MRRSDFEISNLLSIGKESRIRICIIILTLSSLAFPWLPADTLINSLARSWNWVRCQGGHGTVCTPSTERCAYRLVFNKIVNAGVARTDSIEYAFFRDDSLIYSHGARITLSSVDRRADLFWTIDMWDMYPARCYLPWGQLREIIFSSRDRDSLQIKDYAYDMYTFYYGAAGVTAVSEVRATAEAIQITFRRAARTLFLRNTSGLRGSVKVYSCAGRLLHASTVEGRSTESVDLGTAARNVLFIAFTTGHFQSICKGPLGP